MLTRIHVNKQVIASNRIHDRDDPPLTVKQGKNNIKCHEVAILGPSRVIHAGQGRKPLSCGAKVWIETEDEVVIL